MILCVSLSTNATSSCYLPEEGKPAVIFTISGATNVGEAEFSISETKKIVFAKGNLQYQPSTKTWRIAARQYDFVGGNNNTSTIPNGQQGTVWENSVRCDNTTNNRRSNYTGWLDTFFWGTSGWYGDDGDENADAELAWKKDHNPLGKVTASPHTYTSKDNVCLVLGNDHYQGFTGDYVKADWGVRNNAALGGTEDSIFRTPTKVEFAYLLENRTNATSLRARAHIRLYGNGSNPDTIVNGLILLPDDWDPSVLPETPIITDADGNELYETNEFTAAEWQILEVNGAIFLPAGGSTSKFNRSGFYWSSTSNKNTSAWNIEFGGYGAASSDPQMKAADKASCRAVRLVMEVKTPETPETPVVTKTCDDYEKVNVSGIGGTITSTQNELDHCVWNLTATPTGDYKFAYWTDLSGAKEYTINTDIHIETSVNSYAAQAVFVRANACIYEWLADEILYRTDTTDVLSGSAANGFVETYIDGAEYEDEYKTVTRQDYGLWSKPIGELFDDNTFAGKRLHMVIFNSCKQPSAVIDTIVPVAIASDANASGIDFHSAVANTSVQVFDGATLTIDENKAINGFLDIHAGGKVIVADGAELDVQGIIMRGNGIVKKWAQLEVNGTIANHNSNTIYYDYTIDQATYYPLALPSDLACADVSGPINGNTPATMVYVYNSKYREDGIAAWEKYNHKAIEATYKAGKGYAVIAQPQKWNGSRQQEAILRFPITINFSEGDSESKIIDTYTNAESSAAEKDRNWNLIGNPFMANITLGHITVGKVNTQQGIINDSKKFVPAAPGSRSLRYITYSTDGFYTYEQEQISSFVMKPFNSYFTQTSYGDKLLFAKITEPVSAPGRRAADDSNESEEIEAGVILSQGSNTDHIGLLFGDFTEAYELNADLAKEFGSAQPMSAYSLLASTPMAFIALPMEGINRPVPVGYRKAEMSEMTFSFDDSRYDRNLLEALWLTDQVTGKVTNLMLEDYTFMPEATQDDNRFFLSLEKRKVVDVTTAVDEVNQERTITHIYDMLGREVNTSYNMLPQGVYVITDNLGTTRKEIIR